jgi:hypothetical protein
LSMTIIANPVTHVLAFSAADMVTEKPLHLCSQALLTTLYILIQLQSHVHVCMRA